MHPNTWEVEARGSIVEVYPWLHKASLGCVRPRLKTKPKANSLCPVQPPPYLCLPYHIFMLRVLRCGPTGTLLTIAGFCQGLPGFCFIVGVKLHWRGSPSRACPRKSLLPSCTDAEVEAGRWGGHHHSAAPIHSCVWQLWRTHVPFKTEQRSSTQMRMRHYQGP